MKYRKKIRPIPIVDLFAGPGGLGEGFSMVGDNQFRIVVSAEMEPSAHSTLQLRAFFRLLHRQKDRKKLDSYYSFCNGETSQPFDDSNRSLWKEAEQEALKLTLGNDEHNSQLDTKINTENLKLQSSWVLIGGPPCQAYSLVGRARNKGKKNYSAADDARHYLYKEYLRIIEKYQPAIFVMENVKGILSSSVNGQKIFHNILQDLSGRDTPNRATYKIYSLTCNTCFCPGDNPAEIKANDFLVKAEDYGIPQARHRVILLGVREDIRKIPGRLKPSQAVSVFDAIGELPTLRSTLSKEADSGQRWAQIIRTYSHELGAEAACNPGMLKLHKVLMRTKQNITSSLSKGSLRIEKVGNLLPTASALKKWYKDKRLKVWLNHQSRGHMNSDLKRYLFAAAYAEAYKRSPKGHKEFSLTGLSPNHLNWKSGKFADRFRVQIKDKPATTITSHISKDGHYFIHYDPNQCRSLTVREAARLQSFPDNYFFQGNRTQQFHQVGNAVPPYLAYQIGKIVLNLLK